MDAFVALYRGINVGGKNSVKMEVLRAMHEQLGHQDVRSYIQSGNIVFSAKGSAVAIARKTATEFASEFQFPAKVMVVAAKHWDSIVKGNPYAKQAAANPKSVHAGVCDGDPDEDRLSALLAKKGKGEAFVIGKSVVYLHAPDGIGNSHFAAGMEKACGVPVTARNWRTMETLWKMIKGELPGK